MEYADLACETAATAFAIGCALDCPVVSLLGNSAWDFTGPTWASVASFGSDLRS